MKNLVILFFFMLSFSGFTQDVDIQISGSQNKCESTIYKLYKNRNMVDTSGNFTASTIVSETQLGRKVMLKNKNLTHSIYIPDGNYPSQYQYFTFVEEKCEMGRCSNDYSYLEFNSSCRITHISVDVENGLMGTSPTLKDVSVNNCRPLISSIEKAYLDMIKEPVAKDRILDSIYQSQELKDVLEDNFASMIPKNFHKNSAPYYLGLRFLKTCLELDKENLIFDTSQNRDTIYHKRDDNKSNSVIQQ